MTLKTAVESAVKDVKAENRTTGKTPAFYMKALKLGQLEACQSPVPEVRIHMAGSSYTTVKNLKTMLEAERDTDVLTALLTNPRMPVKSLKAFMDTPDAEMFREDDAVYQYVTTRIGTEEPEEDSKEDSGEGSEE